jgi:hypothetical protein
MRSEGQGIYQGIYHTWFLPFFDIGEKIVQVGKKGSQFSATSGVCGTSM